MQLALARFLKRSLLAVIVGVTAVAEVCPAQAAPERKIIIEQVEVLGVTALSPEAVESSVEISTGEPLDQDAVVRTSTNLRDQYKHVGYEQVRIDTRLVHRKNPHGKFEDVLEIQVDEGKPTRIAEIQFFASTPDVPYKTWKHVEKLLVSKVALKAGTILSEDELSNARRAIQEVLTSEEYIGSKIEDVTAVPVQGTGDGRWVRLEFRLQLGEKVSFGFRGNTVLNTSRLMALVDEQRALGLGKDYVSAIRTRVEDEYRSLGFAKVKVESFSFESTSETLNKAAKLGPSDERHITFAIDEGPRVRIESVAFDGNTIFSETELKEQFYHLGPPTVDRGYYVEKDVRKAAELVIEWIKSKGYLGAKLVTINTSYPPKALVSEKDSAVRLVIYIYESDQTLVRQFETVGVTVFDRTELEKILGVREGQPLNLFAFSEGLESLKAAYRAHGYLSMSLSNEGKDNVVRYSEENHFADVRLEVSEGPQYRVTRIDIEGREQTHEKVISREVVLKPGDVVEEPKIAESEANLRRLGIFSNVKVRALPDPDNASMKVIRVTVEEAPPGVIAGGPGFRNDLGIRAFSELGYTNLWGLNHSIFFDSSVNRRIDNTFRFLEYQMQLAYNWPWFVGTDLVFRPTINLSGTQYSNFDATTASIALNWQKQIFKKPNLVGLFTYSLERVNQFNAPQEEAAVDDGIFRIGAITPALRLDLRDNPLAPTQGLFSQASLEWADPVFLSQRTPSPIGYTKFQFRTDYTLPLAYQATWLFSFRNGYERSTQSHPGDLRSGAIPLIKQFALGGIGSLRGFSEQELNFRSISILGTLTYVNYRTQIDLPLAGALRFGPFLDAANLQVDTFSFGNLRYGTGFGFRYLTPVGPVNLDYGFKIDPRPNESPSEIYFSIGVI